MLGTDDLKKLIFNKYKVKKLIHSSGFADVYEGINEKEKIPIALKFEKRNTLYKILESEAFLLVNLKGFGIPKIITYGHHGLYNVLIEELLGNSIGHIYDSWSSSKFNLKDICMLAIQCLDRLEYIHSKFVIHRDIKPYNLVIGRNDPNVIYLIDFGLSRKYRSSRTGKHIKFKNLKLTYGSLRYLSINGNRGYEQSRRDDLESLGYMLIFLATGKLPWMKAEDANLDIVKKYLFIYKIKKSFSAEKICEGLPEEMVDYINYCKGLHFEEDPNYNYLKSLFGNILININQENDLKFSWIARKDLKEMEERNKSLNRNESKNKNLRSISPHLRILNQIKKSLEIKRSFNIKVNDQNNEEKNIGNNLEEPTSFIYKDNEDNISNYKEKEKENSINEGDQKKEKKINKNIESESTKERDLKATDKSLSTSCDKRENKYRKPKKKKFKNVDNKNYEKSNFYIEKKIGQENNKIFNEEKNKIFELNYQNFKNNNDEELDDEIENDKELGELYNNYNKDMHSNKDKQDYIEKRYNLSSVAKPVFNKIKMPEQKYQSIKFISNNNFWNDTDNSFENNYKFNTYYNRNLHDFDIGNFDINIFNNNYCIENSNNKITPKITTSMNNNIYPLNNKNNYYVNDNFIPSTLENCQKNNFPKSRKDFKTAKNENNISKDKNLIMQINTSFNKGKNIRKPHLDKFDKKRKENSKNIKNIEKNMIYNVNMNSISPFQKGNIKDNPYFLNPKIHYIRKLNTNIIHKSNIKPNNILNPENISFKEDISDNFLNDINI